MNARDWLTLILSVWGALVSTALAVRTFRADRVRLRLRAFRQCNVYKEGSPVWRTRLSIVNVGRRQAQITGIRIVHRNGHTFLNDHPAAEDHEKLPCILAEGQMLVFNAYAGDPPGEAGEMCVVKIGVRAGDQEYVTDVSDEVESIVH